MPHFTPPVRRVARGRGHVYEDANGLRVPSVTGILSDGVPKPALVNWAGDATADYAINHWDELSKLAPAARLKKLQKARYEDRDTAANRGTTLHALAERLVAGEAVPIPDELAGHAESYVQFLNDWEPEALFVETVVMSHKYGYAGTFDLGAHFNPQHLLEAGLRTPDVAMLATLTALADVGEPTLAMLDVKTSRSGIFGETALQLSAYRYADTYVDANGNEQPVPGFHIALGLHVRADGYDLRPVEAGQAQLREFLYAREVGRFVAENSRGYIGDPLSPPRQLTRRRLDTVEAIA